MLKNIVRFECKINEKDYQFTCDNDSPLEHIKEAFFQFTKYVGQLEDNIKAQQALQSQQEQKPVESIVEEVKTDG